MYSMLPSLRAEPGASDFSSGGSEFDEAIETLRAQRRLRDPRLMAAAKDLASNCLAEA
jgi:hypothetical protein